MAGALDDGVLNAVINEEFKVIAGGPAVGASIAQSILSVDAVNNQRYVNAITNAALMEALGQRSGMDVSESAARGHEQALASSDVVATLGNMQVTLQALAQAVAKIAQTTRPETGAG
jgi:hypothetical protein